MGFRKVDDNTLCAVADAIRKSAGTTEQIVFPNGFVDTINTLVNSEDYLADAYNGNLTEIKNSKITKVPRDFQQNNTKLTVVDLPSVTALNDNAFSGCTNLTEVKLDSLITMASAIFQNCTKLKTINLPSLSSITGWGYNFNVCISLEKVIFPKLTGTQGAAPIGSSMFNGCEKLTTLVLGSEMGCPLGNINAFNGTPIANGTGYIYVPKALVDSYKTATNWVIFADQIRAIEDYPQVLEGQV